MGVFLGLLALTLGAVGGAISGKATADQMQAQYDENVQSLERTKTSLGTEKSNLTENYGATVGEGLIDINDYIGKDGFDISDISATDIGTLNYQLLLDANAQTSLINAVSEKQASTLNKNAQSNELTSSLETQQLAELNVQASQAVGQAQAQVAYSGFRNTGSAVNVVKNQEQTNRMTIDSATGQINLTRFSRYNDALTAYTDSETQKSQYELAIQNQIASTKASIEVETMKYNQNLEDINTQIEYAEADYADLTSDESKEKLEESKFNVVLGSTLSGGMSSGGLNTLSDEI